MGRWSYFVKDHCKEIILVDFSDAISWRARTSQGRRTRCFFKCDLKRLPFRDGFADFLFCLGVLHHLPTPCLDEVRSLKRAAPRLLIFLYYALDNRPWYFRLLLRGVTGLRRVLNRIRSGALRKLVSLAGTWLIYLPLILLGRLFQLVGAGRFIPLYDITMIKASDASNRNVYDRFFTRIEQRVSRQEILGLAGYVPAGYVSERFPYWHFVCEG